MGMGENKRQAKGMMSLMKTHGLYHANLNNACTYNLVRTDNRLRGCIGKMKLIQFCPPLGIWVEILVAKIKEAKNIARNIST